MDLVKFTDVLSIWVKEKLVVKKGSNKGNVYEDLACRYLENNGLKVLRRNFRCRFGEIDIIARERDILCFVEVKKRKGKETVSPEECFDTRQINRIRKTSLFYLLQTDQRFNFVRYDFLFIIIEGENLKFNFIKGAFDYV